MDSTQVHFGQWILHKSILGSGLYTTVWKYLDFSITQILREIDFGCFRGAKSAISTHLEAVNFDFDEFLHFLKTEIYLINKIQSP